MTPGWQCNYWNVQEDGAEGWWNRPAEDWGSGERLLACGAAAVADLRAAVFAELGYTCSAGEALSLLGLCGQNHAQGPPPPPPHPFSCRVSILSDNHLKQCLALYGNEQSTKARCVA